MTCLLPQFKCSPDTFAINFKSQTHSSVLSSKSREVINFRTQCILSTTSSPTLTAATAVLEQLESIPNSVPADRSWTAPKSPGSPAVFDLELPSLDTHTVPIAAKKPWTFVEAVACPSEVNLGVDLGKETLLTNEDAAIVAAASEALALAKAAVKVAKDAAMMVSRHKSTEIDTSNSVGGTKVAEIDDVEPSAEELQTLEILMSKSLAVRSEHLTERKLKRIKATNKVRVGVLSAKDVSSNKKKKNPIQELDHSDPLRYLRWGTVNRILTRREERVLSLGVQVLLSLEKVKNELVERNGDQPTLPEWAEAAGMDLKTLREKVNYGIFCKDKMVNCNVRLVISIAKRYKGTGMSLQDLVQVGCRGLIRGVEKFDGTKGFKFSTYAHWWIKQAVRKSISENVRLVRLPFHMVEATYKVKEARKRLKTKSGIPPNNEELAREAGITMARLNAVMLAPKYPRSLDRKFRPDMNLKPLDVMADPNVVSPEEMLRERLLKRDLSNILNGLSSREKLVITWRYGLDDGRPKTLQEIGEVLGVSRERIRQLEVKGFRKIRSEDILEKLEQYAIPGAFD